jgi:hypothetical protein
MVDFYDGHVFLGDLIVLTFDFLFIC